MIYQIVIIGGGPGGYVAAIRAAQMGARVALIEQGSLGGTCLNRGCIPTKALLAGAARLRSIREAERFGITVDGVKVDFARLAAAKDSLVKLLAQGVGFLLKKNKVDLIQGRGRIVNGRMVEVVSAGGMVQRVEAENIVLATGSDPAAANNLKVNGRTVVTSTEALAWTEVPASLLIIGGGVVGCEFATLFSTMGSKVTVVEMMPEILPMVDGEMAGQLKTALRKAGVDIRTGTRIAGIRETPGGVAVALEGGGEVEAGKVLVSVGRRINSDGLGLEDVGVAVGGRGEIQVNDYMQTNVPGVYAVGDVTGRMMLAHVASQQGVAAVQTILGMRTRMDYHTVPNCIYTHPEIATVGLSEGDAREQGYKTKVGKFPFVASGRALCGGEASGFVKIVARSDTDEILGVHIIGPQATELIAEGVLAIGRKIRARDLASTIHAHPTLSEAVKEAAEAVHGLSIHY